MLRRSFLQFSAAAAFAGLAGRSLAADQPTAADLAGDIAILSEALRLHPGLYRYSNPAEIAGRLKRLGSDFTRSRTSEERYLLISRFLASIRCGHSYCNFFNQKKATASFLFDRPTRLPFRFVWLGETMVVTSDPSGALSKGTEVLTINGTPAQRLRDGLLPYVRADGHNDGKRVSLLEVRGDSRIETFDVFQGLLAPPADDVHKLTVRPFEGAPRRVEVPAIGLAARQAQMITTGRAADAALWEWQLRPDGIAVLTMPSWALWNSKWDWKSWLDERLNSAASAKGLIVDLRDNEGGQDCGDLIIARLINRAYVPEAQEQRLRFRRTPPGLDPFLDTWDDSFRTLGVGASRLPNGFYRRPGGNAALTIEPAKKRLKTRLAVLTSPVNSSATFQFASSVRALGVGRLVGRTTGGNRRGINGGCFFFVRLPASGIEFDLPLVGYFPMAKVPDAGLVPDIAVQESAKDLVRGRDATIQRAVETLAS